MLQLLVLACGSSTGIHHQKLVCFGPCRTGASLAWNILKQTGVAFLVRAQAAASRTPQGIPQQGNCTSLELWVELAKHTHSAHMKLHQLCGLWRAATWVLRTSLLSLLFLWPYRWGAWVGG